MKSLFPDRLVESQNCGRCGHFEQFTILYLTETSFSMKIKEQKIGRYQAVIPNPEVERPRYMFRNLVCDKCMEIERRKNANNG
jgi:hypothetical protein